MLLAHELSVARKQPDSSQISRVLERKHGRTQRLVQPVSSSQGDEVEVKARLACDPGESMLGVSGNCSRDWTSHFRVVELGGKRGRGGEGCIIGRDSVIYQGSTEDGKNFEAYPVLTCLVCRAKVLRVTTDMEL